MVGINRGSIPIVDIRRGSVPIVEVRRGSVLVWQRTVDRFDDFNQPNGPLSSNWTDHGPSIDHKIGIQDGRARILIPDGLIGGSLDYRISQYRWNLQINTQDDGFVECRPGTRGDAASLTNIFGYFTHVFGRLSNSAFTNGVGISMAGGHLWIVRRSISLDAFVTDCGTFQPGDRLRLRYVGNVHTMLKNGATVGVWNDSGTTAAKGAGFRSLGIRCDGAKDLLGPRRFSPSLDYVMMG